MTRSSAHIASCQRIRHNIERCDPWTRCARTRTVFNRRMPWLGASAYLSGLESRDQMASVRVLNGRLEEARGSQLRDPHHRRRYSSPTAIQAYELDSDATNQKRTDVSETTMKLLHVDRAPLKLQYVYTGRPVQDHPSGEPSLLSFSRLQQ